MKFDDTNVEKHLQSVNAFLEAFHISDAETQQKLQQEFMKIDFPYLEKTQAAAILERFHNGVLPLLEEAEADGPTEDSADKSPANLLGDTKEGEVLSFRVSLSALNKTVKDLKAQLGDVEAANAIQKGMERESAQSDDENIQFVLALNNLATNPQYYNNLATFENGENPKIATLKDTTLKDADPSVASETGEVSIDTSVSGNESIPNEEPTAGESLNAEEAGGSEEPSEEGTEESAGEETPSAELEEPSEEELPEEGEDEDEDKKKKDDDFDIDEFLASVDSES